MVDRLNDSLSCPRIKPLFTRAIRLDVYLVMFLQFFSNVLAVSDCAENGTLVSAENETEPKLLIPVSDENENGPKLANLPVSAPKTKTKTNFGRSLPAFLPSSLPPLP